MTPVITPVILCGGSGTRLWPRSRSEKPKPFLDLIGTETLFKEAVERCRQAGFEKPVIVTGRAHVDLVHQHVSMDDVAHVIVEPEPRQTAAAVALAALLLPQERIMLVCPSDHHIGDSESFAVAARTASQLAAVGSLVCLSVPPTSPETRFGYVQLGEPLGPTAYKVQKFHEKPDRETAEIYFRSQQFAWNGGIFAFEAGGYLSELQVYRPRLAEAVRNSFERGSATGGHFFPDKAAFSTIEPESLDYAVMENTDRAATVIADMEWSDVGDWPTLRRLRTTDSLGNAVRGPAELIDCRNTLVDTDGPKVHMVGVEDLIVVVDGDDILIASGASALRVANFAKSTAQ
jgi:mannose-1-phosphate guanylyltransferase